MATVTSQREGTAERAEGRGARSRKEAAMAFLKGAAAGRSREAFDTYTGPTFKHHNVYFPGDAASLRDAMDENAAENPEKTLEVKRVLEDGDLVAVHSSVRHKPGDPAYALVHIFRFDGDRIAELWDLAQEVPADSPNEHGAF